MPAYEGNGAEADLDSPPERQARLRDNITGALRMALDASPRAFAVTVALALAGAVIPTLIVLAGRHVVNLIVSGSATGKTIGYVLPAVAVLGLLTALQRVYTTIQSTRQETFSTRVSLDVEHRFFEKAAAVDVGHFDDSDWHDRMSRARWDLNWRPYQMTQTVIGLGGSFVQLAGMTGVLMTLHPALVVLSIVSVLPTVTLQRRVNRHLYRFHFDWTPVQREQEYLGTLLSYTQNVKELRSFDLGPHFLKRHQKLAYDRWERRARLYAWAEKHSVAAGALSGLALAGAYAFVAVEGIGGRLTAGDLTAVIAAVAAITQQVGLISSSVVLLDQHARFLDDYFSFLRIESLVPAPEHPRLLPSKLDEAIEFDNVTFTYPGGTEPAVAGLDLRVEPGELLALVGDNGAGKTTLVKLLLRFYDPSGGRVRIGDIDLREVEPRELRRRIGVLFQDYVNYELRARDNVTFGRWERPVDDDEVRGALESARADGVVKRLPGGLDSNVGRQFEGGQDLSGGEWQRLALARLIYRDADIWVLDEPTASLDAEAEAAIFGELREQLSGRMGIVISHRFSTVRIADRIAVVADGRVTELGTHDELVALGGRYAELFALQAAGYR